MSDKDSSFSNSSKQAKQELIFCSLILFSNVFNVVIISLSDSLRRRFKFQTILSVCICNIYSSLTYFPFNVNQTLKPSQNIDSLTTSFIHATGYFVNPAIMGTSITVLGIDHIFGRGTVHSQACFKCLKSLLGVVLPWAYGLVAYVPCLTQRLVIVEKFRENLNYSSSVKSKSPPPSAISIIDDISSSSSLSPSLSSSLSSSSLDDSNTVRSSSMVAILILWGILPIVSVIAISFSASVLFHVQSRSRDVTPIPSPLPSAEPWDDAVYSFNPRESNCTIGLVLASIIFVCGNCPLLYDMFRGLECMSNGYCVILFYQLADFTFFLIRWAVCFLWPAVWFLDHEFRTAVITALNRICLKICVVY